MKFRTRYLIAPKFQLMFSAILVLIALISTLGVGLIIYKLIYANTLIFVKYNVHASQEFLTLLAKEKNVILLAWVTSFLTVALFLFFAGILLSHKMSGPLYALTREMKKLQEGDYTAHLGLRKGDEFKELKAPFNQWVEMLKTMTAQDIEKISQLIIEITALQKKMQEQKIDEAKIFELNKILDSLNRMLQKKTTAKI